MLTKSRPNRDQKLTKSCPSEIRDQIRVRTNSPPPTPSNLSVQREVFQILRGGVDSLDVNDHGRPWPYPNRAAIARLLSEYDHDLCLKAAREAREIVQAQDRAPNITGLFEKKLHDLAAVRSEVRDSLEGA